jgi:hypothetical protein
MSRGRRNEADNSVGEEGLVEYHMKYGLIRRMQDTVVNAMTRLQADAVTTRTE